MHTRILILIREMEEEEADEEIQAQPWRQETRIFHPCREKNRVFPEAPRQPQCQLCQRALKISVGKMPLDFNKKVGIFSESSFRQVCREHL